MGDAIGEILPLAVGVAVSPLPIVAAVLILLSPRAKTAGPAFLLGWVIGLVTVVTATTLLAGFIPPGDDAQSQPITGVLKLLLALALLGLAVRQFTTRPRAGEDTVAPQWMSSIATMSVSRSAVLGLLFAAVNPKNLLLGVAAGVAISAAGLAPASSAVLVLIFVLIGSLSVTVPIVSFLVAPTTMAAPLESLRVWLLEHNSAVMAVLFLILGVKLLGDALASF